MFKITGPKAFQWRVLGTLSECLFFFGIYSFHSGGIWEVTLLTSNFWRRKRHLFLQPCPTLPSSSENSAASVGNLVWGCVLPWYPYPYYTLKINYKVRATFPRLTPAIPKRRAGCFVGGGGTRRLPHLSALPVAYGHTTGNTPEPVRFQKLSLVRPS